MGVAGEGVIGDASGGCGGGTERDGECEENGANESLSSSPSSFFIFFF